LIITYDEHGGFFDHLAPPDNVPDDHGIHRYGPRVPAIVVSPYVETKAVSHTVLDHTSIIRTILTCFCADRNGRSPTWGRA
jgi:phospholipase C